MRDMSRPSALRDIPQILAGCNLRTAASHSVLPGLRCVAFCVASLRRISRHLVCSSSNLRFALPQPPPTREKHEGFCSCRKPEFASLPPKAF